MQQNIRQVIAHGTKLPDPPLEPERGESEGVVVRRRAKFEPNPGQSIRRPQRFVALNIGIVVPDKVALRCGKVNNYC